MDTFLKPAFILTIIFSTVIISAIPGKVLSNPGVIKKTPHAKAVTSPSSHRKVNEISTVRMEAGILGYINLHRKSMGLHPLQLNNFESVIASQHSKNMASGRTPFGHRGLQLRMNTISRKLGTVKVAAENVAYGQMSAREVVDSWLQSYGHRKNIEGDFKLTGIGCAKDSRGNLYYTQIFTR